MDNYRISPAPFSENLLYVFSLELLQGRYDVTDKFDLDGYENKAFLFYLLEAHLIEWGLYFVLPITFVASSCCCHGAGWGVWVGSQLATFCEPTGSNKEY